MKHNILAEIKTEFDNFTRVEKSIAREILNDPKKFISLSMTELSEKCGVSQGSINNFSQKLISDGFSALKLRIAGSLSNHDELPFALVDGSQGIKAAMELKIRENIEAFRNTLVINEEANLQSAVKKIMAAKKIEIYGVFHSGIVANDFCFQLIQLGIPATYVGDHLLCAVSASMLDSDCLVIAISSSGSTKPVIDAVRIAKDNGVPIIGLTAHKSSPLSELADDILLAAPSGMSISDGRDEIRLSQRLVLDTLCAYLRSIIDVGGKNHYYKLRNTMDSYNIKIEL